MHRSLFTRQSKTIEGRLLFSGIGYYRSGVSDSAAVCLRRIQTQRVKIKLDRGTHVSPVSYISLLILYTHNVPSKLHTPMQFDLLVDHLLQICKGTDYDEISDTFDVLALLHGSPSTLARKSHYLDMTIRFMGHNATCFAAVRAACAIRPVVVSMGRDNESFRERFSTALASVVMPSQNRQGSGRMMSE
jgi:hypothetical protein